jgi:hypothetical protein
MWLAGGTQPALAQSPDCIIPITKTEQRVTFGFVRNVEVRVGERIAPECLQDDGRVNRHDAAAGAIVYCLPDGGVAVYDVDTLSRGDLALSISAAELTETATASAENTMLDSSATGAIRLYRLTSGELQLNSPAIYPTDPEYVFIWGGCAG